MHRQPDGVAAPSGSTRRTSRVVEAVPAARASPSSPRRAVSRRQAWRSKASPPRQLYRRRRAAAAGRSRRGHRSTARPRTTGRNSSSTHHSSKAHTRGVTSVAAPRFVSRRRGGSGAASKRKVAGRNRAAARYAPRPQNPPDPYPDPESCPGCSLFRENLLHFRKRLNGVHSTGGSSWPATIWRIRLSRRGACRPPVGKEQPAMSVSSGVVPASRREVGVPRPVRQHRRPSPWPPTRSRWSKAAGPTPETGAFHAPPRRRRS